jgi:hypothetical protein
MLSLPAGGGGGLPAGSPAPPPVGKARRPLMQRACRGAAIAGCCCPPVKQGRKHFVKNSGGAPAPERSPVPVLILRSEAEASPNVFRNAARLSAALPRCDKHNKGLGCSCLSVCAAGRQRTCGHPPNPAKRHTQSDSASSAWTVCTHISACSKDICAMFAMTKPQLEAQFLKVVNHSDSDSDLINLTRSC